MVSAAVTASRVVIPELREVRADNDRERLGNKKIDMVVSILYIERPREPEKG